MHSADCGTCFEPVPHCALLEGLPEHREILEVLEEYQHVLSRLRKAVAAQEGPQHIAALDEKLEAVFAELSMVAKGVPLPATAAHWHNKSCPDKYTAVEALHDKCAADRAFE